MIEPRVSLKRARELLAERGDRVGQSALSRYLSKYSDVLDPRRDGRETTVDFEALAKHRSENITERSLRRHPRRLRYRYSEVGRMRRRLTSGLSGKCANSRSPSASER